MLSMIQTKLESNTFLVKFSVFWLDCSKYYHHSLLKFGSYLLI